MGAVDLGGMLRRFRMPSFMVVRTRQCLRLVRALVCYHLVAFAQMLSPAAAADPASRIDPPAWSYVHSQQELQSYGIRVSAQDQQKSETRRVSQVRLKRILERRDGRSDSRRSS